MFLRRMHSIEKRDAQKGGDSDFNSTVNWKKKIDRESYIIMSPLETSRENGHQKPFKESSTQFQNWRKREESEKKKKRKGEKLKQSQGNKKGYKRKREKQEFPKSKKQRTRERESSIKVLTT